MRRLLCWLGWHYMGYKTIRVPWGIFEQPYCQRCGKPEYMMSDKESL